MRVDDVAGDIWQALHQALLAEVGTQLTQKARCEMRVDDVAGNTWQALHQALPAEVGTPQGCRRREQSGEAASSLPGYSGAS